MQSWEFATAVVRMVKDDKGDWEWVGRGPEGPEKAGIAAVANSYGRQGWELVATVPDQFDTIAPGPLGPVVRHVTLPYLTLLFKRQFPSA